MEEEVKERRKRPLIVTYLLLISTVFVQIYVSLIHPSEALSIFEAYSLVPASLFRGVHIDSLVTYMFLHGNLLHLFVNSIALFGAGSIVEQDIGHLRYFLVFFASGVLAGLMHCLISPWSDVPLVGSSGAIFGVIAILFLLMPFKLTFIMIVPLPSVIVGIMLSLVELSAFYMANDIGIAHDVHLAGFLVGGISAFIIDQKRALRGLIIATIVLALMYYAGIYLDLIPSAA